MHRTEFCQICAAMIITFSFHPAVEVICIGNRSNKAEAEVTNKGDELIGVSKLTAFGTISVAPKVTTLVNLLISRKVIGKFMTN